MDSVTESPLGRATELERDGRALEAIEVLLRANRESPSREVEEALMQVRHRAFRELGGDARPPAAPQPVPAGDAREDDGMPVVDASELTGSRVAGAIGEFGALLVRGLIDPERADHLRESVDRAFDAREAYAEGADDDETSPWFKPFVPADEAKAAVSLGRGFITNSSGVLLADSPRITFELLETFREVGFMGVVTDFLGERPAISVNKGTLRRSPPGSPTGWHQDGAFLGRNIRALNVWMSLTHSGERSPGMQFVNRRLERIVETGTPGAAFDWSVSDDVAERVSGGRLAWPIFAPGDAVLFDQLSLHRASLSDEMTETRYATETWFFAPGAYPDPNEQVPLAY